MAEFIISKGILRQVVKANFDIARAIGVQSGKAFAFRAQQFEEDQEDATSYLGTPIFDPVVFPSGQFNELGNVVGPPQSFDQLIIPAIIIEVNQLKNIITTVIQGRNGTVKEFVSDGDFAITLTGMIVGRNEGNEVKDIGNVYPIDDVKKLVTICKVPDVLTITSTFLNDVFSINEVVVIDYNIPQREASRNMQPFQISLLSDTPIQLNELEI